MRLIAALILAGLACHAQAAEKIQRFYGYAYDLKTNQYLYTEVHRHRVDGDRWIDGTMDYYDVNGAKIASKTLDFATNPYIPIYRLDQFNAGYIEGISKIGEEIELFKQESRKTKLKTDSVEAKAEMAADSGFHSYIRAHFDALMKGETVGFTLIAAGQLDAYHFRLRKTGETTFADKPAVTIVAEPNSLLRYLVDPLDIIYDPATKKLLEYRGISNIHDPATGDPYITRIVYSSAPPADAPKKLPPLRQ